MTRICASCGIYMTNAREEGLSSLYSTRVYILCVPCFEAEDALIKEKGTNNIPEEIRRYEANVRAALGY